MSSARVQCTSTAASPSACKPVEHAKCAGHLSGQNGLAELEHVVACHVQYRRLDLFEVELALPVEERQLLDLLMRSKQVALDAI